MLAKDKHVIKYSKFYLDRGIEVLRVRLSLFDLLRPTKGSQVSNIILIVIYFNLLRIKTEISRCF